MDVEEQCLAVLMGEAPLEDGVVLHRYSLLL
jgi:hypothetical protein